MAWIAAGRNTLTITDNRTGRAYELPIEDGTIRATELRKIKVNEDDFGLMTYDPAFMNTAVVPQRDHVTSTATAGSSHTGAIRSSSSPREASFLEVAYLLIHGELPTQPQLDEWVDEITTHTFVHENIKEFMQGFRYDAHPMGMLLASVGALSTFYPEANRDQGPGEPLRSQVVRLIAKMPTIAAFSYRHNRGLPYVYPDNDLVLHGQLPLDDASR